VIELHGTCVAPILQICIIITFVLMMAEYTYWGMDSVVSTQYGL